MRLAVVVPWYGAGLPGGAEALFRGACEALKRNRHQVEVFTTTLGGFHSDWGKNALKRRESMRGVEVHRFPVRRPDRATFELLNTRILAGESLNAEEAGIFEREMMRCDGLAPALAARQDLDAVLVGPYMFATTLQASRVVPDRTVLWPCLHDEGYARLPTVRQMFESAAAVLFNTRSEAALAQRLYGLEAARCTIVGAGVDLGWEGAPARCATLGRFFLYLGRRDALKNVPLLLEYFERYRLSRPEARLVLAGPGSALATKPLQGLVDLGFVSEARKRDLLSAAVATIQPSLRESFSLVCAESWAAKRPVLVNGQCAATREQVEASGGGLFFDDFETFAVACDRLLDAGGGASRLGERVEGTSRPAATGQRSASAAPLRFVK